MIYWIEKKMIYSDLKRKELNFPEMILNWILNWINLAQNSNFELNQFGYQTGSPHPNVQKNCDFGTVGEGFPNDSFLSQDAVCQIYVHF